MKKILVFLITVSLLVGCASTGSHTEQGTRKGAVIGALSGAVLGQLIGGDTKGTLIGAGIGVLAGGAIGRRYGKQADEQEAALKRQLAAIEAANVQRNADILAVTFRSDMLFDMGSSQLKPGAKVEINRVSRVLTEYSTTRIRVDGHTDATGSRTFNQQLSELRATNVKLALVEQGVHPGRIKVIGFGQSAPIASNDTEGGRRLNRRVIITISPEQG